MQPKIPVETATRVYRRYLKLEPTHVEEYIAYLKKKVCVCAEMHSTWQAALHLRPPRALRPEHAAYGCRVDA